MKQQYELIYNSHLGWVPDDELANFKLVRTQIVRCSVQDNTPSLGWPLIRLWMRVQSRVRDQMCEQVVAGINGTNNN